MRIFEGHGHYVMMIAFNPKDPNSFASASLDRTIMIWNLASSKPNYTLSGKSGHTAGCNCVSFFYAGDKPYLLSGSDDLYGVFFLLML